MRFKNYDDNYREITLKDVCTLITKGTTPAKFSTNGINFIKIDSLNGNYVDNSKVTHINESIHNTLLSRSILEENDILLAIAGATVGKHCIIQKSNLPANTNQALAIIRLNKHLLPYYLLAFFDTNYLPSYIKLICAASAQPNLNLQQVGQIKLNIPTIQEQEKVCHFIQLLDKRIFVQNKIISKYETLIKGIIDCLLNKKEGNYYTFKDLYLKAGEGGTPTSDNDSYYKNGTIPFIKIDDLSQKYIKSNSDYITHLGLEKSSAWLIPANSVIFSNGATIGRISINTYPIATKQGVLGVVPSAVVMTEYLYYYMKTTYFRRQVRRITVKGTMDCAYLKDLNGIICHIPEINHQEKRIALLTVLDKKIACEKTILQKLKEQKKYLLSKMFI